MTKIRFNSDEYNTGANKEKLPHFWFHLENQRFDVVADVYPKINSWSDGFNLNEIFFHLQIGVDEPKC